MKDEDIIKHIKESSNDEQMVFIKRVDNGIGIYAKNDNEVNELLSDLCHTDYGLTLVTTIIMEYEREGNCWLFDNISELVDKIRSGVHMPNEKCKHCSNFCEKSHGFGYCDYLERDIDGEEDNWKVVNNKNGCISFNDKREE